MAMKLSEVFSSLLLAENKATENVGATKDEVDRLHRKTRADFEFKRKTALGAARAEANALVKAAKLRGDNEAVDILNAGESERKVIIELFDSNVRCLMSALANEVAEEYVNAARNNFKKL